MKRGRLRMMEEGLASQIAEFRANFGEVDLEVVAKSGSSLGDLKTAEQYSKDRDCSLQTLLTIPRPQPIHCQYSVMLEEVELCSKPAFTVKNLPILLNQFYMDRLQELIQLKHMMLLRWTRLALGRPKVVEELSTEYHKRIEYLMLEYNDTLNRSRRLSDLCSKNVISTAIMDCEDILPFLRWLIYHQHTTKKVTSYTAHLQWLPLYYEVELVKALLPNADKTSAQGEPRSPRHKSSETAKKWISSQQSVSSMLGQDKGVESQLLFPPTVASSLGEGLPESVGDKLEVGSETIPLHQPDVTKNHGLLQELMLNYNIVGPTSFPSMAEELQFYYQVMRKFQSLFHSQETASTCYTYDKLPEGESHAKLSKSKLTFKKPSNWVPFVRVHATPDPVMIQAFAKMKQAVPDIDPLLSLNSKCTHLHNLQRVLYALKQHSVVVRHPSPFTSLSVTTHKTPHDSLLVWKCIYSGLDSRNPLHTAEVDNAQDGGVVREDSDEEMGVPGDMMGLDMDMDMPGALKVILNTGGRRVSAKARQVSKDAYLGFLLLRHLKIRDLRHTCLQILNYFRSVERTLTVNAEGLSLEHNNDQKSKKTAGLLDHGYLFRTPMDYKVDQSEFMRYMEVENHDDFYAFDTDGSVQVWDQRGVAIMYDITHEDLKKLETELLTVASYYMRRVALKESGKKVHVVKGEEQEEEEMQYFSQRSVDRFGILLDLWTCESRYLQAKMKVCNCYLEAYQHTLSAAQRTNLHHAMVTVMASRPRYDPEALYFTEIYNKEVQCLEQLSELLLSIINHLMCGERSYNELVCNHNFEFLDHLTDSDLDSTHLPFGLPLPLLTQQVVSLTGDRHLQVRSYLFEFSESLCILGNLPRALQWGLTEACTLLKVEHPKAVVTLHCKLLELAANEWILSPEIGTSHSTEVYRQLFLDDSVENPSIMADVFLTHGNRASMKSANVTPVEQKIILTKSWIDVLQLVSLRHHLLHTCLENEYLTKLYKRQLVPLDYEDCHAHLRCISFDHSLRFPFEKNLDFFITQAREEVKGGNPRLDHYSPTKLRLAVHELDDKGVGAFSFCSKKDILKILSGGSNQGLECVKASLQVEVVQRNCLVMACQQNGLVIRCSDKLLNKTDFSLSRSFGRSSQASATPTPTSGTPPMRRSPLCRRNAVVEKKIMIATDLKSHFVSIQQRKAPVRDHMLAQFTKQPTTITRDPEELDKCKCSLISSFATNLNVALSVHSLRVQSIRYYQNLLRILDDFPATRDAHFILGEVKNHDPNTKFNFSTHYGIDPTGRLLAADIHRSKPHQLLSRDGKVLLNLFYIPHFTEVLYMFEELPIQDRCEKMMLVLGLAAGLHQLMQYICAYVELGGALDKPAELAHEKKEFGAFWGGTESIGSQLLQLQVEIGRLSDPCNPKQVTDFLRQRCHILFYHHDIIVRHYLRQSLLSTKNYRQLQILDTVSIPACHQLSLTPCNPFLSGHTRNVHYPQYGALPHPYDTYHSKASSTVPWRAFFFSHGLFPSALDHSSLVGAYVYVSLACLDPEGLSLAHGEFVGMSLVQEDILQANHVPASDSPLDVSHKAGVGEPQPQLQIPTNKRSAGSQRTEQLNQPSLPSSAALSSSLSNHTTLNNDTHQGHHLNILPMEYATVLEKFLVLTSQLEQLKMEWGLKVLNCHTINTKRLVKDLEAIYKERILRVAKKTVAKMQIRDLARKQAEEEANDLTSEVTLMTEASADTSGAGADVLDPTAPIDEFKLREVQVKSLLDNLEQVMISETSKYLSKLYHLMLNERERDDAILPLDLWKSNAMNFKELTGVSRSHVVEDFVCRLQSLMSVEERGEEGEVVSLSMADLKECVHVLSSGVLAREKECYQLYASYYEALLRSQYNQLYQKNRDIEHYKALSEANAEQSREEVLCFMGEHTHNLILEITALRGRVDQLQSSLEHRLEGIRRRSIMEYGSLVDELFSASLSIKDRFEEYRGDLYGDMTRSLSEVKQSVHESVQRVKEKLGLKEKEAELATPSSRGHEDGHASSHRLSVDGVKVIQDENAELNKQIVRMRAVNNWSRHKAGVIHNTELFSLQNKLNSAQLEYLALKMNSDEEILSLKQQVQVMQKHLGKVERECEMTKQSLKEEKQKQSSSGKSASRNQESFLSKAEKTYAAKLDRLVQELEEKEKQLKMMDEERERTKKHREFERGQVTKVVHGIKQQLSQERSLKLDAFHQVDHLVQQVQQFEDQTVKSAPHPVYLSRASPQSTNSLAHIPPPSTPNLAVSLGLQSISHSRICSRPRTQQHQQQQLTRSSTRMSTRMSGNAERRIDLGQEIIALKLI